jgi:hypothetical protein
LARLAARFCSLTAVFTPILLTADDGQYKDGLSGAKPIVVSSSIRCPRSLDCFAFGSQ